MIGYLQGKVILKKDKFVILDVKGVGYKVFLSGKALDKIIQGEELLEVFCSLYVRENALDVYGFLSRPELELFELLLGISGIGPKASLEISSLGPLEDFKKSIEAGDEKIFGQIAGIGQKKAKKILLELSGKIKEGEFLKSKQDFLNDPAYEALVNLGFSKAQVKDVLSKISRDIKSTEDKIKTALRMLGR